MAEEKEWWDDIEQSLNDAETAFREYGVDVLLEELEHLFLIKERLNVSVGRCKKAIADTIDEYIREAKEEVGKELTKKNEGAQ